jgi:hypothetical protein
MTFMAAAALLRAQTGAPKTFNSPEEARDALVKAADGGMDTLRELLGVGSAEILTTGDPVQDKQIVERFKRQTAEKTKLEPDPMNDDRFVVLVGAENWPFAVPLLRTNGHWYFDIREGKKEIRNRTIGANELDAIQVCRGFVEAQEMYVQKDWDGGGVVEYARRILSTPGKKDGLYWPGDDSPLSEAVARAVAEGYPQPNAKKQPYHGYNYKLLYGQGAAAEDGARDYIIHDLMIGGFALIAWPAAHGVSGIKTFIVNQDGVVYEKDLGPKTSTLAPAITKFNPDSYWDECPDDTDAP